MTGSLTHGGGQNVPAIPGACANRNFAHLVRGLYMYIGEELLTQFGHMATEMWVTIASVDMMGELVIYVFI